MGRWPIFCFWVTCMTKARVEILALLEPAVEALGYELVDLEVNFSGRRGVLRLFIDHLHPDGRHGEPSGESQEAGIRVEDCEAVSRQVSAVLDVEDPIRRDYDLEVSSPGLDRKLTKPGHFDRFAGQAVQGRLRTMLDKRRRFTGTLLGRQGTTVTIRVDDTDLTVPMDDLEVIRLVPEY